MQNNTGITTKIKHFSSFFEKRTYQTFKIVINGILSLKDWKQGDLANLGGKSLGQIQYFFNKSRWNFKILNELRLKWIRNKIGGANDKLSDILILDGTVFAKNKASTFSGLTDYHYSNKDKKVVNGLELFGASIYTKNGLKYILGLSIFQKIKTNKEKFSNINYAWRKFTIKMISKTKSWLVVLDSGFKGANMCKNILQNCKRDFLVRIWEGQIFFDKDGNKFKINDLLKKKDAIYFPNGRMWVFKNIYLQSWKNKGVKIALNIIVFHKNGPKKPSVLATSASLKDVYEKMIRQKGDDSWEKKCEELDKNNSKKALKLLDNQNRLYYCFVDLYGKRWSIEECFKELKSYLCFEKFKVASYEAIMKYLNIVLLVHSLLYIMLYGLMQNKDNFNFVYDFLKEKRNIKNKLKKITIMGLKLFIEMMFQLGGAGKIKSKSKKKLKNILKNSICLNYVSFDKIKIN